ncbi:MAG: hypothetical protein JST59_13545 [Actinobacteria bacterium]|nr:hypothetical protein [Actinomycetota bacterium]
MNTRIADSTPVRIALLVTTALLLALVAAPLAKASDTFRFDNETGVTFFSNAGDNLEEGCWYNPTGVLREGEYSSTTGSITGQVGWSCESEEWGANLEFGLVAQGEGVGIFEFVARDPLIGDSSVSCPSVGAEIPESRGEAPIERFMTSEAEGDVCIVEWVPGVSASDLSLSTAISRPKAGHVRIIDSLARVFGGKAHVRVQVFGVGHARHDENLVLRDDNGELLGRASRELRVGDKPQAIAVPLPDAVLKTLAKGKDLRINAAVQIDSPGGTGDTTPQLVLSERQAAHH